jgi:hypothetical protein
MKLRVLRKPPILLVISAVSTAGLALSASAALAQANPAASNDGAAAAANQTKSDNGNGGPGASNQDSVSGVVVQAPSQAGPPIPPDKKAAFDAEVAKQEAWKRYRQSTPPASAGTIGQSDDYPGLRSLLPGQDQSSEGQ